MPTITTTKEVTRTELREMLYEQILAHGPEHFNQRTWVTTENNPSGGLGLAPRVDLNACGTTACLAGHAAALASKVNLQGIFSGVDATDSFSIRARLGTQFGIDNDAFDALSRQWPEAMRRAYQESKAQNPNEQDAEWWGALQYLASLRDRKD